MDEWLVGDGCGEFVAYYNSCGRVMHFTKDRGEARKTTDSREAFEIARVARELYRRKDMRMSIVMD